MDQLLLLCIYSVPMILRKTINLLFRLWGPLSYFSLSSLDQGPWAARLLWKTIWIPATLLPHLWELDESFFLLMNLPLKKKFFKKDHFAFKEKPLEEVIREKKKNHENSANLFFAYITIHFHLRKPVWF